MNICIFGLGYVGCVSAACFAKEGHIVRGVDINQTKVDIINAGKSPIIEKDIGNLIKRAVASGKLRATVDPNEAVASSDISLVCVGTPSNNIGILKLDYVFNVAEQIGNALRKKQTFHAVVIRSTVLPGTVEKVGSIIEEKSAKRLGIDFGVAANPEFLREGKAVADFYNPPYIIIGASDKKTADLVAKLYEGIKAPLFQTDIKVAEMIKYANNAFHALKVAFANEIGRICKSLDIDSHKVMEIFSMDTKLNISTAYLKPGFAFGGSCLPKDIRALLHKAQEKDVEVPLLKSVVESNEIHKRVAFEMIKRTGRRKVGIIGLSFKGGTDDLRESPAVALAEMLIGKGYDLLIYDPNVSLSKLIGANKEYIQREIPHIDKLMEDDLERVLEHAQVIVLTRIPEELNGFIQKLREKIVIDFARMGKNIKDMVGSYEGICW